MDGFEKIAYKSMGECSEVTIYCPFLLTCALEPLRVRVNEGRR